MFAPLIAKPKSVPSRGATVAAQRLGHSALKRAHLPQRSIGNEAILGNLPQQGPDSLKRRDPRQEMASRSARKATLGASWEFSTIPVSAPGRAEPFQMPYLPIQARFKVGPAHDPLEQEADRVTSQVMRMSEADVSVGTAQPQIGNQCDACDEERLQNKDAGQLTASVREAPGIVHQVLRSQGQPLDAATKAYFEPRFGHDFSRVRVHTATRAVGSARAVQARAYTVGSDIVFNDGQFAPHTSDGKTLLAHELTHVVQQDGGALAIQRSPDPKKPEAATRKEPEATRTSGVGGPAAEYEAARKEAYAENAKREKVWQWINVTASEDDFVRGFIRHKLAMNLKARVEKVKTKGQLFRDVKQWRERFRALHDASLKVAQGAMSADLQAEFKKATSRFHIFEHERTPHVGKKLAQLAEQGVEVERIVRANVDVEYQYELEAEPIERASMEEGAAIIKELDGLVWEHKPFSKSIFESLVSRINQWDQGVDRLMDIELKAKAHFTGSGPVSRPSGLDVDR